MAFEGSEECDFAGCSRAGYSRCSSSNVRVAARADRARGVDNGSFSIVILPFNISVPYKLLYVCGDFVSFRSPSLSILEYTKNPGDI